MEGLPVTFVVGVDPAANTSTTGDTVVYFAPKETHVSIKELNAIAQELDELSDEMPALADLSERIGKATDVLELDLPQVTQRRPDDDDMPRYLREIYNIVQNEVRGAHRLQGVPDDLRAVEYYRMRMERTLHRSLPSPRSVLLGVTGV